VIGCPAVLVVNGKTHLDCANFSQLTFAFHISGKHGSAGIVFAVALGSVGGLSPAAAPARKEIFSALREI